MSGVVHKCVAGDSCTRDGELTGVCCLFGRECWCCSGGSPDVEFVRVVVDRGDVDSGCEEREGVRGSEGSFRTVSCVVVQARAGGA